MGKVSKTGDYLKLKEYNKMKQETLTMEIESLHSCHGILWASQEDSKAFTFHIHSGYGILWASHGDSKMFNPLTAITANKQFHLLEKQQLSHEALQKCENQQECRTSFGYKNSMEFWHTA